MSDRYPAHTISKESIVQFQPAQYDTVIVDTEHGPSVFCIAHLFGEPGYCIPLIVGHEDKVTVYHASHYLLVEEMLTHSHSSLREIGRHLVELEIEDERRSNPR